MPSKRILYMNKYRLFVCLLTLLLCRVNKLFSQEWEYEVDYTECSLEEAVELPNGNIAVSSYFYRNEENCFSYDPAVLILSSDGIELNRNIFFREGYTTTSFAPYLFVNDGELYALSTYSPDHNYRSPNYFMNYDIPPTDAKIVLSKLDDKLNIVESYEHSFPIDTFEDTEWWQWQEDPNLFSGNIFMFSTLEDEGNIIGAYIKKVSADIDNPRGNDSLFLFRMNFEGELLDLKGYETGGNGLGVPQYRYRREQIVKTDSHYIFYDKYNIGNRHGKIVYYDKEFNHITTKYMIHPDYNNSIHGLPPVIDPLEDITVFKLNDKTTYLSVTVTCDENPLGYYYNDVRLYKLDDNIENSSDFLSTDNYIHRGTPYTYERAITVNSIVIVNDTSMYFAYNCDLIGKPYSVIEYLNTDMDTISTFIHDKTLSMIKATKDGGLFALGYNNITKFPASAFVSIEEAHAHNLKVAVAYPNPGGDVMNIRTSLRNCTLQVYDMQGRMVYQQNVSDDVTSVDASNWPSGTYVWKLTINNEQLTVEEGKWVK